MQRERDPCSNSNISTKQKKLKFLQHLIMDFSQFNKKAKGYECLGPSSVAEAASYANSCNLSLWMNTRYKAQLITHFWLDGN